MLIDAATLATEGVTLTGDGVAIGGRRVDPDRGWIRRLAPEGWADAMDRPGVTGAERSATMSALAAIARDERFTWLTTLDLLGAAENKPLQYRRAAAAGVPVPEWVVTTDPDALPLGGMWVSKPLGPGSFIDDAGHGWIVPTSEIDIHRDREVLARVPFVLQRRLNATQHARVVTVGNAVYSATLPADGLPLDWRLSPAGHEGFTSAPGPESVHTLAAAVARCLGVGYSAQDWIRDSDGLWWFVDLNPAGQWLFLPNDVSEPITAAIAEFLDAEHLDGAA